MIPHASSREKICQNPIGMYSTHPFLMVKNPGKKGAHYIHRITVHVTVILTVVEVVHVVVTSKI